MTRLHLSTGAVLDVEEDAHAIVAQMAIAGKGLVKATRMGKTIRVAKEHITLVEEYEPDNGAPIAPDYADSAE